MVAFGNGCFKSQKYYYVRSTIVDYNALSIKVPSTNVWKYKVISTKIPNHSTKYQSIGYPILGSTKYLVLDAIIPDFENDVINPLFLNFQTIPSVINSEMTFYTQTQTQTDTYRCYVSYYIDI